MKDGHLNKCKECQKKNTQDARNKRPEYYREYDIARSKLPHRVKSRKEYSQTEAGKLAHAKALKKQKELYPHKAKARYAVSNALRDGKLFKKPCEICGEKIVEAHHSDYSNPLEVIWLCNKHHNEIHNNI